MTSAPRLAVVTVAEDLHAHVLKKTLRARHGVELAIIESDRLAATGLVNWSVDGSSPPVLPDFQHSPVDLSALDLLWWRRPSGKGWNANSGFLSHVTDEAARDLIYNDCVAALNGLVQTSFHGTWVNHPEATRRAETKFLQLQTARALGLPIPRTLVSQNPDVIRDFCKDQPTIVKAIAGTVKTPLMAHDVDAALLANDEALSLAPAIYQQRIDGTQHLRVHAFGERFITAHIACDELDWRVHLEKARLSRVELPKELESKLRRFMQAMDLKMGIFDLKIDSQGQIWWLEVNPQGQFLFIEGMSGIPLAEAFSDFLVETARMPSKLAA